MRKLIAAINMTFDGFCDHTVLLSDEEIHQHYTDLLSDADAIDKIPKIVFSHTLKDAEWESARLSNQTIEEEVLELKQRSGKAILVGSRSLIIASS